MRNSFPSSSIIEGLSAWSVSSEISLGYHFAFTLIRAIHSNYPMWIKNVLVNCFNSHLYNSTPSNIAKLGDSKAVSSSPSKISLPWPSFAMPLWRSRLIRPANEVFLLLGQEARPWAERPVKSLLDWLDILSSEDVSEEFSWTCFISACFIFSWLFWSLMSEHMVAGSSQILQIKTQYLKIIRPPISQIPNYWSTSFAVFLNVSSHWRYFWYEN